jgi:hypothetical protein
MCRHPQLKLGKPQVTSAATAKGFTITKFAKHFDIFQPMLRLINLLDWVGRSFEIGYRSYCCKRVTENILFDYSRYTFGELDHGKISSQHHQLFT